MFQVLQTADLPQYFTSRDGEIKLGQTVKTVNLSDWEAELSDSLAPFVLLGIPEDIGVRANYGVGGAHTLWEPALRAILNTQHTETLDGSQLLVLGAFDFGELMGQSEGMHAEGLRSLVSQIDDAVYPIIQKIVAAGKIPIVIGGGHNNAYPLLKGAFRGKDSTINTINLDAHSDYRKIEGRHSGNGFRYAMADGYLKNYSLVGLHRNYNSEAVLADMAADPHIRFSFFEDIFLNQTLSFDEALSNALRHTAGAPVGIELDFDCIEGILSSAMSPCGISTLHARNYIVQAAQRADIAYLHLTEGATELDNGLKSSLAAKLAAYFVTDFLRARTNKNIGQLGDAVL